MYKVTRILEGDYGCEERLPGEKKKAILCLVDQDGNEIEMVVDEECGLGEGTQGANEGRGGVQDDGLL